MREEDIKLIESVKEILEKDLREEMNKIKSAGTFAPEQVKKLDGAVCLMFKMDELEEWLNGNVMSEYSQRNMARMPYGNSYAPRRSSVTGRFVSRGPMDEYAYADPYARNSYEMGRSGHSTKDRMIARLEDMMGEAKNEYEAQMIRDAIGTIQSGR